MQVGGGGDGCTCEKAISGGVEKPTSTTQIYLRVLIAEF